MLKNIDIAQTTENAGCYFGDGYHCAEAVVAAFLEAIGEDPAQAVAHASPFGGGIGRTFEEVCGVLSGSMIAIGHLYGRKQRGESWDLPASLGAKAREIFIQRYGTSICLTLRERFGEENQMAQCRTLVQNGVADLIDLIQKELQSGEVVQNASPEPEVAGAD